MAASVRIEDEAFSDRRYDSLARECGLVDADHARGKMAVLWRQCTLEGVMVLPTQDVIDVLGPNAVHALKVARLGDEVAGGIRIRGTKGRIEWLKKLRSNGKFGKKGGRPKRNPDGLAEKPMRVSQNAKELTPPAPAPAPAPSGSQSTYTGAKGTDIGLPVVSDAMVAALPRAADWRARKGAVVRGVSALHAERFNALRDELGSSVPPMGVFGDPAERALQTLLESLPDLEAAEASCRHVLAVREEEAKRSGSLQWFGAIMWSPDQFARAKAMTLDDVRSRGKKPAARPVAAGEPVHYAPRKIGGRQ